MSTEARNLTTRDQLAMNGISSPEKLATIAQDLVHGVKALSSDQGYRYLAELLDRIPKLEKEAQAKENELEKARQEMEKVRKDHKIELNQNLRAYGDEYNEFKKEKSDLGQRIGDMQKGLLEKENTVSGLEEKIENLKIAGRKVEETCKAKTGKLKAKEGELAQALKQVDANRSDMEKLVTALQKSQSEVATQARLLNNFKQRNTELADELGTTQGALDELRDFSITLTETDVERVANDVNTLWTTASALIRDYLGHDLPEEQLKRPWTTLNAAAQFVLDAPLPQSNSAIAKELRIVKVLTIVAELIDKYTFQPTYLLSEESQFKELLYKLAVYEPKRERFLRGMMLAIQHDEQRDGEQDISAKATKELMRDNGVEDIVSTRLIAEFEQGLRDILDDAQDAWRAVQFSTSLFACDFEHDPATNLEWQLFKPQVGNDTERADTSSPISTYDSDDDLVVLFPRVYLMIPREEPRPITTGTVIRKSHIRALVREEHENAQSTEQAIPRSRKRPGRTLSMGAKGARGVNSKETFLARPVASSSG